MILILLGTSDFASRSKSNFIGYAIANLRWCSFLGCDFDISLSPTLLFCDNASTIFLTSNPVNRIRSKHIDTDYHYVREIVKRALILKYIPFLDQLADLFTNTLGTERFLELTKKINVCACLNPS